MGFFIPVLVPSVPAVLAKGAFTTGAVPGAAAGVGAAGAAAGVVGVVRGVVGVVGESDWRCGSRVAGVVGGVAGVVGAGVAGLVGAFPGFRSASAPPNSASARSWQQPIVVQYCTSTTSTVTQTTPQGLMIVPLRRFTF